MPETYINAFCHPIPEDKQLEAWVDAAGHYIAHSHSIFNRTLDLTSLNYCVAGGGWLRLGDVEYKIRAGDIFYCPPHMPHSYRADEALGWDLWWVIFGGSYAARLIQHAGFLVTQPVLSVPEESRLDRNFSHLVRVLSEKPFRYTIDATGYLLQLLLSLKKWAAADPRIVTSLNTRIDFQTESLDAAAEAAGYSKYHFIRLFQSATGMTPWRYILHLKIDKAKELLLEPGLSVKAVASAVGFEDPRYFTKIFKRTVSVPPAVFRATHGNPVSGPTERSEKQ